MILALIFVTVTLIILAGALGWATTSTRLTGRNVEYFRTEAAAEAATEKVLAAIATDYHEQGDWYVQANLDRYKQMIPTNVENAAWGNYEFSDGQGHGSRTYVQFFPPGNDYKILTSQFKGLSGWASSYRVISNARQLDGPFNITGALLQEVDVATIPLFQFAIFYNLELEICPAPNMTVTGPVYCNTNIYLSPGQTLTFQSDVKSAGYINLRKKLEDPSVRTGGTIVFNAEHDDRQSPLTLPIGTNNTPAAVRQIIEVPPVSESVSSAMGKERFYNKADVIIAVNAAGAVVATSGTYNNFMTLIPTNEAKLFVNSISNSFTDQRAGKVMKVTQLDISQLREWNRTNMVINLTNSMVGGTNFHSIRIVYVVDQRTNSVVRLVNGDTLLPQGLTIASQNPVYIKGHYNSPAPTRGTSDTTATLPAAVVADAISILSAGWNDANSALTIDKRTAIATTVNAAFLAGIVPTTTAHYSGGVENFPRFLENWSGQAFTYNGSMVVMFESKVATAPWPGTGVVYNPPIRNWAFDQNFHDVNKLPPGTPCARAMSRGRWAMIKPGATN